LQIKYDDDDDDDDDEVDEPGTVREIGGLVYLADFNLRMRFRNLTIFGFWFPPFLQRVSIACYAKRCTTVNPSVCPSIRPSHAGTVSKRLQLRSWGLHCRIAIDSSFLVVNFGAKFEREPREPGRRMREG